MKINSHLLLVEKGAAKDVKARFNEVREENDHPKYAKGGY
jgi:hypothetical protein